VANQWYIRRGSKVLGPSTSAQLKSDAAAGLVKREDEVSQSPTGPWTIAQKVKGLFASSLSNHPAPIIPTPKQVENNPVGAELNPASMKSTSNPQIALKSNSSMNGGVLIFLLIFVFCAAWGTVVIPIWNKASTESDHAQFLAKQANIKFKTTDAKHTKFIMGASNTYSKAANNDLKFVIDNYSKLSEDLKMSSSEIHALGRNGKELKAFYAAEDLIKKEFEADEASSKLADQVA
jgi:hypothetical protein